jgi:hypothetical protein
MSDEGPNNQELIDENPPPALFDLDGVDMIIIAVRERRNAGDPGRNDLHSRTKKAKRHPHIILMIEKAQSMTQRREQGQWVSATFERSLEVITFCF